MAQVCRPLVFWGQSKEYVYIKVDISEIPLVSLNLMLIVTPNKICDTLTVD